MEHSGVWCEICGEPHYTQDCYYSIGYPAEYYEEPYSYSQPNDCPSLYEKLTEINDMILKTTSETQQSLEGFQTQFREPSESILHSQSFEDHNVPAFEPNVSPTAYELMTELLNSFSGYPIYQEEDIAQQEIKRQEAMAREREYEEQRLRLEAQTTLINDICAKYRETFPFTRDQSIYWDDEDEYETQPSSSLAGLEILMDEEVPPPVQQEPMDDDFWSDNEIEEDVGLNEERSGIENKMADEKEYIYIPSWEDEFGEELDNLPTPEEGEFDHVGDLLFLETLLAGTGTPTTEFKNTPNEEKEEEVVTIKETKPPRQSQDYRPVPPPSRERVRPGKCRTKCSDPFEFFKRLSRFTIRFLTNNGERSELNGLDRGWIKEKPPD